MSSTLNILITIALVYTFSMTWGLLQERIAAVPYNSATASDDRSKGELFPSVLVLNLCQSLAAWAVSGLFVSRLAPRARAALPGALSFLRMSVYHTSASPVMYSALAFIAYPHVTLVSSVKLVPMMVAGYLVNGRTYSRRDIACAVLMSSGVALYSLKKALGAGHGHAGAIDASAAAVGTSLWSSLVSGGLGGLALYLPPGVRVSVGVCLVLLNLSLDGLVGAAQDAVHGAYRKKQGGGDGALSASNSSAGVLSSLWPSSSGPPPSIPPVYMMHWQNGWGAALLATYLTGQVLWYGMGTVLWPGPVGDASDSSLPALLSVWRFIGRHPECVWHLAGFALCGTAAQLVIYSSLASLGSFTTTGITLSRKFFSILLSTLVYGHALSVVQWAGIGLVFTGLVVQLTSAARGGRIQDETGRRKRAGSAAYEHDQGQGHGYSQAVWQHLPPQLESMRGRFRPPGSGPSAHTTMHSSGTSSGSGHPSPDAGRFTSYASPGTMGTPPQAMMGSSGIGGVRPGYGTQASGGFSNSPISPPQWPGQPQTRTGPMSPGTGYPHGPAQSSPPTTVHPRVEGMVKPHGPGYFSSASPTYQGAAQYQTYR